MPLSSLFRPNAERKIAHQAYVAIVTQARAPDFFLRHGVPDTLDGRFEMIVLHAFLLLHRLRGEASGQRLGQVLFDVFFTDMDRSLREMGTGDLSVGKEIGRMAEAVSGRIAAYQRGFDEPAELEPALRRNLFGTVTEPATLHLSFMAAYMRVQSRELAGQPGAALAAGTIRFLAAELDFPAVEARSSAS